MTRKFKALGLALIAVFAMSAVAASGAQAAEEHTFKSEVERTNYTGFATSEHVFTAAGGAAEVRCNEIQFDGTEVGKERDEVTIVPTYDDCNAGGLGSATVTEHHCAYVFDSDTTEHNGKEDAPVDIECSGAEGKITINVPNAGVTLTVGPQENLHGVHYENVTDPETKKEAVEVEATVTGIAWNCSPAFLCTLGLGASSGTDATYNGDTIVTGFKDEGEEQKDTAKTTTTLDHGDPVNVTMTTP